MGFVLSLLYFVTCYLTPATVFGPFAAFHVELVLAVLLFFVSLPALSKSLLFRTPQSIGLIGLALAVFLSVVIGTHWVGGAARALLAFIPNAYGYFLVCLHCDSKKRLQVLIVMLLLVCLFVITHGSIDLLSGVPQNDAPHVGDDESDRLDQWNLEHPYLFAMRSDAGEWFYRLRGMGQISDPNDFGQLIVCVIPLTLIFWRRTKVFSNILRVIMPVSVLLFGLYLTHSRGALMALVVIAVVALRRRIGTLTALLLAGGLFLAASAVHFTGGREISAVAGADRTDLWGAGLQLFKAHPLFGVGFDNFANYAGLTAHNSIVVCAGELGLFGLYFWSMFLFPTVRDALTIASPVRVSDRQSLSEAERRFPNSIGTIETPNKTNVNALGLLAVMSLTGFLVTGLFLSRSYVMTLFLLGGIVEVMFEIYLRQGMVSRRMPLPRVLVLTAGVAASLVVLMYFTVNLLNLIH